MEKALDVEAMLGSFGGLKEPPKRYKKTLKFEGNGCSIFILEAQMGANMVPKIFKKSTKTGAPHRPRKLKKQPKMGYPIGPGRLRRLLGSLGESWARFGGILGRLGCILGQSWAILGRTSGQHGSNLGAKMELK